MDTACRKCNAAIDVALPAILKGGLCDKCYTAAMGSSYLKGNMSKGEVTSVDPKTGGTKGTKLARFDLLPVKALQELAEHFGKCGGDGDQIPPKYRDRNWEKGYLWSWSYAAAQRHLSDFWAGEDMDALSKSKHVICAAWHCLVLATFMIFRLGTDDRSTMGRKLETHDA